MKVASNKNCVLGLLLCSKVKQLKLRHIPHTLTPLGSLESPVSLMFRTWRKPIQAQGEKIKAQNHTPNIDFPIKPTLLSSTGLYAGFRAFLVPGTVLVHARQSRKGDVIRLQASDWPGGDEWLVHKDPT